MENTTEFHIKKIKAKANRFIGSLRQNQPQRNRLGFQIISIKDFKEMLESQTGLINTLYTSDELAYCNNRLHSLAGRYAAKLAARKALQQKILWTEMNIPSSLTGQPWMTFLDGTANISISITHDTDIAAAFVACPTNDIRGKNVHDVQIGLDVTYVSRITKLISNQSESLLKRILTVEEREESKNDVQKIVEKWSGKEAVSKALGTGIGVGERLQNIEILTRNGKPFVRLNGGALAQANVRNLHHWEISFMCYPEMTFAFVIASD